MSDEEIGDIKYRLARFKKDLACGIPDSDTLTFNRESFSEYVAAYWISSSLDIDNLKNKITETTKELKLTPSEWRTP